MRKTLSLLLLMLFIAANVFATIPVKNAYYNVAAQVCTPSDTNPSCGVSGSVASVANTDKTLVISPTTGSVIAGINYSSIQALSPTGINWNDVKNYVAGNALVARPGIGVGVNWESIGGGGGGAVSSVSSNGGNNDPVVSPTTGAVVVSSSTGSNNTLFNNIMNNQGGQQ